MFALLKRKNPQEDAAAALYAVLLAHIRNPRFYRDYGVPDTFDGRFDLLVLHAFFIVNRLAGEGREAQHFNQALFDVLFADMDQTLREMGIGDMGVPKHMRRMMKGFNGRMRAYRTAVSGGEALEEVLRRNLYGTVEHPAPEAVKGTVAYMRRAAEMLAGQKVQDILRGQMILLEV